jgi:predicted ATP-binding protein involved in virulence
MWIEKIELENFKCFEKKTIEFSPGFNVIIGDNGTGKTSVLEALKISAGTFLAGFPNQKFERINEGDIRITTKGTKDVPILFPNYPVSINTHCIIASNKITWRRGIDTATKNVGKSQKIRAIALEMYERVREGEEVIMPFIAYYQTSRLWVSASDVQISAKKIIQYDSEKDNIADIIQKIVGPSSYLDGYTKCLNASTNEKFVSKWFTWLEISALQQKQKNSTLEIVRLAIIACLDFCEDFRFDIKQNELILQKKDGSIIPTKMLSAGQIAILSMVADIAQRCAVLNPELGSNCLRETPGIVLIDELDLHLHPKWQRRIVNDLRRTFPKMQFIVTTHSPLIIQSLRRGELIDLSDPDTKPDYEYSGRTPEDILEDGMGVKMPERSQKWQEMYKTATEYYGLLEEEEKLNEKETLKKEELREKLNELMMRYEEDPAFAAYTFFLKQKNLTSGIDNA